MDEKIARLWRWNALITNYNLKVVIRSVVIISGRNYYLISDGYTKLRIDHEYRIQFIILHKDI